MVTEPAWIDLPKPTVKAVDDALRRASDSFDLAYHQSDTATEMIGHLNVVVAAAAEINAAIAALFPDRGAHPDDEFPIGIGRLDFIETLQRWVNDATAGEIAEHFYVRCK